MLRVSRLTERLALVLFLSIPGAVLAESIFPFAVTSNGWVSEGGCSTTEERVFIFSGGFRARSLEVAGVGKINLLCASTDSRVLGSDFYLFMECSLNGSLVTYMGEANLDDNRLVFDLYEYRGASSAPDLHIVLERCTDETPFP